MVSPPEHAPRGGGDYTTELNAGAGFIKYSVSDVAAFLVSVTRFYRISRATVRTAAYRIPPSGGQGGERAKALRVKGKLPCRLYPRLKCRLNWNAGRVRRQWAGAGRQRRRTQRERKKNAPGVPALRPRP